MVPLSRAADVVVASASAAAASPAVQARVKDGAVCVSSLYVVDWLAQPHAGLGAHVLLGSRPSAKVAAAEAARVQG